jgi:cytidylate kinase
MSNALVIAIDGPSGSGKSTVARALAEKMNILYIDTGAMYRALAYSCDKKGIPFEESAKLTNFLNTADFQYGVSKDCLIKIEGENLTEAIREHRVSKLASIISQLSTVRTFLVDFQRKMTQEKFCVMEGRDIGTVVFPNAFCKFFITASIEERSKRRLKQLHESGNTAMTLEQVIEDQKKRDDSDMNRDVSPLKQAEDAYLLDTTDLSLDDIIEILKKECKQKAEALGLDL